MCFFFFKQKTAYEMRISDWSSDVCSSDLGRATLHRPPLSDRGTALHPPQRHAAIHGLYAHDAERPLVGLAVGGWPAHRDRHRKGGHTRPPLGHVYRRHERTAATDRDRKSV